MFGNSSSGSEDDIFTVLDEDELDNLNDELRKEKSLVKKATDLPAIYKEIETIFMTAQLEMRLYFPTNRKAVKPLVTYEIIKTVSKLLTQLAVNVNSNNKIGEVIPAFLDQCLEERGNWMNKDLDFYENRLFNAEKEQLSKKQTEDIIDKTQTRADTVRDAQDIENGKSVFDPLDDNVIVVNQRVYVRFLQLFYDIWLFLQQNEKTKRFVADEKVSELLLKKEVAEENLAVYEKNHLVEQFYTLQNNLCDLVKAKSFMRRIFEQQMSKLDRQYFDRFKTSIDTSFSQELISAEEMSTEDGVDKFSYNKTLIFTVLIGMFKNALAIIREMLPLNMDGEKLLKQLDNYFDNFVRTTRHVDQDIYQVPADIKSVKKMTFFGDSLKHQQKDERRMLKKAVQDLRNTITTTADKQYCLAVKRFLDSVDHGLITKFKEVVEQYKDFCIKESRYSKAEYNALYKNQLAMFKLVQILADGHHKLADIYADSKFKLQGMDFCKDKEIPLLRRRAVMRKILACELTAQISLYGHAYLSRFNDVKKEIKDLKAQADKNPQVLQDLIKEKQAIAVVELQPIIAQKK